MILSLDTIAMKSHPTTGSSLAYHPNPKHKEPWQPGRKGSLCPKDITLDRAAGMLSESFHHKQQRYAVDQGRVFIGKTDNRDGWHGYPAGWREVPETVRQHFLKSKAVQNRDLSRYWERSDE